MNNLGVKLGIDVGRSRVGLAKNCKNSSLAMPFMTLKRDLKDSNSINIYERIAKVAKQINAVTIFVGYPITLLGKESISTKDAILFSETLGKYTEIEICMIDERFSTTIANRYLLTSGISKVKRKSLLDQIAAAIILQSALDLEKNILINK